MAEPRPKMSLETFLAWEAEQPGKHEFLAGEIFAMTGGTDRHNSLALNLAVALREHTRGGPCRVYMADVRLAIAAAEASYYPDVMVTCDERDRADRLVKRWPVLVAEVLSPGTSENDMGAKLINCRRIETLREYLLLHPEQELATLYRRADDGQWLLQQAGRGEALRLESLGLSLSIDALFEDLE